MAFVITRSQIEVNFVLQRLNSLIDVCNWVDAQLHEKCRLFGET